MTASTAQAPWLEARRGVNVWLLYLIFFYALFFPPFYGMFGSRGAILVNGGILGLIVAYYLLHHGTIVFQSTLEKHAYLDFTAIMVLYLISISLGTIFLSQKVVFRDIFEIHRPLLHLASFTLPFLLSPRVLYRYVDRLFTALAIPLVVLALLQLVIPFTPVSQLYTHDFAIIARRVSIPFIHAYDCGNAVSFFVYYFIFRALIDKRYRFIPLIVLSLAVVGLTQSRGAVIAAAMTLAVVVPMALFLANYAGLRVLRLPRYFNVVPPLAILIVGLGYWGFLTYASELEYLVTGLSRLATGQTVRSASMRQEQMQEIIDMASRSGWHAIFGNGVSKEAYARPGELLETAVAFFLYRHGVVGLVLFFFLPALAAITVLGQLLIRYEFAQKPLTLAIFCWIAHLLFASAGSIPTEAMRLSFFYYFMLGLTARFYCSFREGERGAAPGDGRSRA